MPKITADQLVMVHSACQNDWTMGAQSKHHFSGCLWWWLQTDGYLHPWSLGMRTLSNPLSFWIGLNAEGGEIPSFFLPTCLMWKLHILLPVETVTHSCPQVLRWKISSGIVEDYSIGFLGTPACKSRSWDFPDYSVMYDSGLWHLFLRRTLHNTRRS